MIIEENKNLKECNTFGINSIAKYFVTINNKNELIELVTNDIFISNKFLILGGGSNVLLPDYYDGIVINIDIKLIEVSTSEDFTFIKVGAGEDWHKFVEFTVNNNIYGLENLALIPGKVGAAPIQNIGAYGIEQNQFFWECEVFDIESKTLKILNNKDCEFAYRDSIFKNKLKNKVIITEITYKLINKPNFNIEYQELKQAFEGKDITSKDIFNLVTEVRKRKLPDPKELGNSGSFFKNPIITKSHLNEIIVDYPEIKYFGYSDSEVKCSAAWLIEKVGYKGFRNGDAGVSPNHSLILVNYGKATSKEILSLANDIIEKVYNTFKIKLDMEVNAI